uniref:Serpin H1 n=1 Tax=Canis lupus familiaris TaxID=9615 RepID=A0A8C0SVI3_CANLF
SRGAASGGEGIRPRFARGSRPAQPSQVLRGASNPSPSHALPPASQHLLPPGRGPGGRGEEARGCSGPRLCREAEPQSGHAGRAQRRLGLQPVPGHGQGPGGGEHPAATTASQAKAVLSAEQLRDEEVHAGLGELLRSLSNSTARNVTWKLGSRLYGPSSVSFAEDFVRSSKQHYNCEHSKINFRDKRSALQSINEWAAQTTDGKLPEVTKDVERTDGALLVNAMFFKPHWDEKFHHKMVDNRGFMVTRSYTVGVTMMHRTGLYNYYDDEKEKLQIVEMPLAHKLSSLIILMPHHVEPLERLEKLLTKEQLKIWMGKMQKKAVAISLPKGVVEVTHDLQKHLAGLGLTDAIDKNKADLSRMSGKKDLYLASVFHATAFEWDTEGNPFDQDIYGREELRSPKLFYADHPFIFLVRDTQSGSLLFIGRLVRPKGDKMRDEL